MEASFNTLFLDLIDPTGIVVHLLAFVIVHSAVGTGNKLKATIIYRCFSKSFPNGYRPSEILLLRPDNLRCTSDICKVICLMPIGSFFPRILRKKLRTPA